MGYNLLYKHLEEMQPYVIKWFEKYHIMLFESDFEIHKYEVLIDGYKLNPKNMLCAGHIYSIYNAFQELIKSYYYSISAYLIEKELKNKGNIGWSNYWKYEVKNYYFRSLIPRFFSILDYIAVMINELCMQQLIKNEGQVYFTKLKKRLIKNEDKGNIGWLTNKDIKEINEILDYVYVDLDSEEKKILRSYRNKATHRYLVGIDELTVCIHREKLTEEEIKLLGAKGGYKYSVHGKPKCKFDKMIIVIEKLINNLDLVVSRLMKLKIMEDVVKIK